MLYKFLLPRLAKKAQQVITVSNFSKERLMQQFKLKEGKIIVVPNAISDSFRSASQSSQENGKAPFILAVSSVDPKKNFKNLILAIEQLDLEMKLIVVGAQNKVFANEQLQKLLQGKKNIEFTGYISDQELIEYYRQATMFVYPSIYEGFGIPPLEAMSCGCPVIVSSIPSLRETCNEAALYVDPYDVTDIANKIKELLDNKELRQELSKKGLERVKRFSWESSASILIHHFKISI